MSRRTQENLLAVAFLMVFVGVIVLSFGYGPRARTVPLPVAVFGLILIVIQIAWQNLRSTDDLQVDLFEAITKRDAGDGGCEAAAGSSPVADAPADRRSAWRGEPVAFGMIGVMLGLVLLFGPIPAIFIFTAGYFAISRRYSWGRNLVYTIACTAVIYLLFVVALEIQLYHGILEPLVERFR